MGCQLTFAPGCACEHWTLVGHSADAYHYDPAGELRGHHPDCPDYVAPTPEEQALGRLARAARMSHPVRLPTADFTVEDYGRKLTVNWRRQERRVVQVGVRYVGPHGEGVATKGEPLLVVLEPGEVLVIRAEEVRSGERLTMNVDGFYTGA